MHPALADLGTTAGTTSSPTGIDTALPRGELAHSTHLFGAGTYDPVHGERQRVQVTLATAIPEEVVRRANLDYRSPAEVDAEAWASDPDALVVPRPARCCTDSAHTPRTGPGGSLPRIHDSNLGADGVECERATVRSGATPSDAPTSVADPGATNPPAVV